MESLLLRGHAPITEDALTAALGDLLEDLADAKLVANIIAKARAISADGRPSLVPGATMPGFDGFHAQLWPSWTTWGEPDLELSLTFGGSLIAAVAIEAKYEATKSSEDTGDDEHVKDQLARYAAGLAERFPDAIKHVIYLTASSVPPASELADSWYSIHQKAGLDPAQVLRWLSWRDVDRILKSALQDLPADSIRRRRVNKVLALLERAGLRCFDGWVTAEAPPSLGPPLQGVAYWLTSPGRWRTERAPAASLGPPPSNPTKPGCWLSAA